MAQSASVRDLGSSADPPIGTTLEKWLGENVFSEPNGVATTISINLAAVSQLRWFRFALVFMTGLVIGVSLESLNRKSGERKAFEVRSLGYKFRSLSDSIKTRIESSGWPDSVRDLRPAIMSAFISAQKGVADREWACCQVRRIWPNA
jgi:hypothetical protein